MSPSIVPGGAQWRWRTRARRGISLVELLVVIAVFGALLAFGVPAVGKILRRTESSSTLSGIARVLGTARLAAIKGVSGATLTTPPAPVVVLVEKGGDGEQIRLRSFVDLFPANNPDYELDLANGDRILDDVLFGSSIFFWKQGEAKGDASKAILFDTYRPPGATADDTALSDRIVFLPSGGIAPPRDSDSGVPTATAGRGIYFADRNGLNYFRVTIPGDIVARPVTEKWVDSTTGYSSAGWSWK